MSCLDGTGKDQDSCARLLLAPAWNAGAEPGPAACPDMNRVRRVGALNVGRAVHRALNQAGGSLEQRSSPHRCGCVRVPPMSGLRGSAQVWLRRPGHRVAH